MATLNLRSFTRSATFRRSTIALLGSLVVAGALALCATSASALDTHVFTTSFGSASSEPANPYPLSGPTSVAVDQTSHDTYVTDPANFRIEKFDSAGNLLLMFGKEVNRTEHERVALEPGETMQEKEAKENVCSAASGDSCQPGTQAGEPTVENEPGAPAGALDSPTFIALDSSAGPSAGDVYVADTGEFWAPGRSVIQKFDSSGHLITSWGTAGELNAGGRLNGSQEGPFGPLAGIAVDASGNLFVSHGSAFFFLPHVSQFAQDGSVTTEFSSETFGSRAGIALDSANNIYMVRSDGLILRFNSSGNPAGGEVVTVKDANNTTGVAIDPSTGDLYVNDGGSQIDHYASSCVASTQPCSANDSFGSSPKHLTGAAGLAVDPATHVVYVADTGDAQLVAFAPAVVPDVTTGAVSKRQATSATVSGHLDPAGGGEIIECRFQYVTDAAFQATGYSDRGSLGTAPCAEGSSFSTPADVHANLTGLSPLTTYHFRLVAANASGENQSADQTFTTPSAPAVDGESAPTVSSTTVTLNAQINPNFADTTYHFEYGYGTAYGTSTADAGPLTGATDQLASADIYGLQPNTPYHYRVVAENVTGTTPGIDHTFMTLPNPPSATTGGASAVGQSTATLNGTIEPQGAETSYYFEYSGPGTFAIISGEAGSGSTNTAISAPVSGLSPRTTYQYRLIATNAGGTAVGSYQTFTTAPRPPSGPPVVATGGTSNLTPSSTTLHGTVDPNGGATSYQFQYGTSAAYGASLPEASAGSGVDPEGVVAGLSGLAPGTSYQYRLVATNTAGTAYGADQTFTTPAAPVSAFGPSPANTIIPSHLPPPKPLTNSQKLAKALRVCKVHKRKTKRIKCETRARKRYHPKRKPNSKR